MDMDVLKRPINEDTRLTTWCLAVHLGCSHITVETHLNELHRRKGVYPRRKITDICKLP